MRLRRRSYATYSVGLAIAWAIVFALVAAIDPPHDLHTILLVFGGFAIAWVSGTIARYVYPPPARWRRNGR